MAQLVIGPEVLGAAEGGAADADAVSEQILEATVSQLMHFGLRRLTVEDVARRAGVSRITVYRRFPTRDRLVRSALLREARRVFAGVDEVIAGVPVGSARIVEAFAAGLRAAREHPLVRRLLTTEPELALPAFTVDGGDLLAAVRDYLAGHLRDGQRAGDLGPFDPLPVAELMARLALSFVLTPESSIPLQTDAQVRDFARTHILGAVQRRRGSRS